MTKLTTPGKYAAQMSRAGRKSRGRTSAKRKAALDKATAPKPLEGDGAAAVPSEGTVPLDLADKREGG